MDTVVHISDGLVLTMNEMHDLISRLIASAQQKESLISNDDVGGLEELLIEEAEISCALRQKEKELKFKADNLRHVIGIPNKAALLKEICDEIGDESFRNRLTVVRNEMADAIEELNRQNAKLKEILRYRIGYTDFMLNLLHAPQSRLRSYNVQGNKEEGIADFGFMEYRA